MFEINVARDPELIGLGAVDVNHINLHGLVGTMAQNQIVYDGATNISLTPVWRQGYATQHRRPPTPPFRCQKLAQHDVEWRISMRSAAWHAHKHRQHGP
jgi:hypothetical protein